MTKTILESVIAAKLIAEGPVSFADFMDMALYYPGLGYYTKPETLIGKQGDFFTSPCLSNVFGAMIGRQLEEMCSRMEGPFSIVEFGGRNGMLCRDIMDYLKTSPVYDRIEYIIVDKTGGTAKADDARHPGRIFRRTDASGLSARCGCILSNELFDNFPVHRLSLQERGVSEIFVRYGNEFLESWEKPCVAVDQWMSETETVIQPGEEHEISLKAQEWYAQAGRLLESGFILSIDYGYLDDVYSGSDRHRKTLRCFRRHERHFNPYLFIGDQDITADVNFSHLCRYGLRYGFTPAGFVSQPHFLRALGFVNHLMAMPQPEADKIFAANMLLGKMGAGFNVLVQEKNMAAKPLTGMAFQSPFDRHHMQRLSKIPKAVFPPGC